MGKSPEPINVREDILAMQYLTELAMRCVEDAEVLSMLQKVIDRGEVAIENWGECVKGKTYTIEGTNQPYKKVNP